MMEAIIRDLSAFVDYSLKVFFKSISLKEWLKNVFLIVLFGQLKME